MERTAKKRKSVSRKKRAPAKAASVSRPALKKKVVKPVRVVSGFALAIVANLLWGTSFLASKQTLLAWSPLVATSIRFLLALVVMAIALPLMGFPIRRPSSRAAWLQVALVGVFGFGLLYPLQLSGLNSISSGLSASIMLTSPVFVLLLAALFLKEQLSKLKMFAVVLGLVGGVVLLMPGISVAGFAASRETWIGGLLTLAASLSLALSVVLTRRFRKALDAQSLTFWSMLLGLVALLPMTALEISKQGFVKSGASLAPAIIAVIYLAVICSAVAFVFWNRAISVAPAKELATSMHIKTPVALLLGCLIAREALTTNLVVGSLIVMFAVWLSQYSPRAAGPKKK